ncbi:tetratricopeptide repeat protein [Aurantimonas sp. Leaf443]|uniref:tetratricopeptide repeat protein n=1 Tax=Aurantimonas sp. Leaf443 TaxID=1736378 RepID=UPI0006FFB912|nr:tetratricopeptide repeat protein [Aurantimonas sp. Leaf443]KQT82837.1 hypothetical protein ASG48_15230 [Aurantimonas sp. Leaf443]
MELRQATPFEEERRAGLSARAANRREAALAHFEAASRQNPADRWTRNDVALELLALHRFEEARARAQDLAAEAPDFAPARRTLALASRGLGQMEAAHAHFAEAARLDPRDLWNRQDAAACLKAAGRVDEAASGLLDLARGTPLPHMLRSLGEIARDGGRVQEALHFFQSAARLLPADPYFSLDVATALDAVDRPDEARAAFAALRAAHPHFVPGLRAEAQALARRGDPAGACERLREALRIAPGDGSLRLAHAEALLKLDRLEEAQTAYARLLVADPAILRCYLGLARIARVRGLREVALAHLRHAETLPEARGSAGLEIAAEWTALGRMERARRLLEELAEGPRTGVAALVELAFLLRRQEGPAAARGFAERALAIDPANPRALLFLADDRRDRGALDEAEALYDRALDGKPDFAWALIGKAHLARLRGDAPARLALLERADALDPDEPFARIELARALQDEGRCDDALPRLREIAEGPARGAQAMIEIARIYRARGDWAAAADAFEQVARRWPDEVEALVESAEDALRAGAAARADALLAEAGERAPEAPAFLEALARRAILRDDLEEALSFYRRAEIADPSRLSCLLAVARLETVLGRPEAATAAFERALARFGERPDIALARVELQRQRGHVAQTAEALRAARIAHPRHFGLWFAGITAAIDAGDFEAASAALDEAPAGTAHERARVAFARSLLHAARWDFGAAVLHGETALAALPGDGWVRNRLVHAALLDLDLDRAGHHLADLARLEAGANRLRGKSANPSQSHYGQIFDEFRLDAEALAALRGVADAPRAERPAAVAAVVRAFPDNTAAAIRFFIEHRIAGRLADRPSAARAGAPIPPAIHQYWDEPPPPADLLDLIESWRQAIPGAAHRLWNDAEARLFLDTLGEPAISAAYARAEEPAMKADLFRLALLRERGGLYADADDRCLGALAPLLQGGHGLVVYQEDLGSLGNNFIAARPRHPVIVRALDLAVAAVNRGDTDILWLATGPALLTRAAAGLMAQDPDLLADVLVLERHAVLRHVAIHCQAAYKATERHWSRTAFGRARPARSPAQATRSA